MNVKIEASWQKILASEFEKDYFKRLTAQIRKAYLDKNIQIFPPASLVFDAFNHCPFHKVKVVILGQDPYHRQGQAHGLAFSVPDGVATPPSLLNIYKEIEEDLNIHVPQTGNLQSWAEQGVLLLNSTLTVKEGQAGSHQGLGWEQFTDTVIKKVSKEKNNVVFLLWGSYAQKKGSTIDRSKHLVLTAPHPSPLSVYRGFKGCKHFSKTNQYLKANGQKEIQW